MVANRLREESADDGDIGFGGGLRIDHEIVLILNCQRLPVGLRIADTDSKDNPAAVGRGAGPAEAQGDGRDVPAFQPFEQPQGSADGPGGGAAADPETQGHGKSPPRAGWSAV